jgi:hypothetical protein
LLRSVVSRDFRSDKSESIEGKGIARRAWDAYAKTADRVAGPSVRRFLGPSVRRWSAGEAVDLLGFWAAWHLHGGFEGLERLGMSRSTIFRRVKLFRLTYGTHPDEAVFPGITLDLAEYQRGVVKYRESK